ncbi:hypothetical protein IC582_004614 [Cucumis melo]
MASSKLFPSSNSRNSNLSRCSSSSSSSASLLKPQFLSNHSRNYDSPSRNPPPHTMTVDGLLPNGYNSNPTESSILLDAQITLVDSSNPYSLPINTTTPTITNSSVVIDSNHNSSSAASPTKTVDDV